MNNGFLDVLNVGAGHLKFSFNKNDADELAKAKKVVGDMLGRGYMLFVKVDGEQRRVRKFDPELEEYILEEPDVPTLEIVPDRAEPAPLSVKLRKERRVAMRAAQATGIGPTAGG